MPSSGPQYHDPVTQERLGKLAGEYEAQAGVQDAEEVTATRRADAAEG
jgi:hypothetical protein